MREQKKKNGLSQIILTFLIFYGVITLLPACVYGFAKTQGSEPGSNASSPETSPFSVQEKASPLPEEASSAPTASASSSNAAPGFLDGLAIAPQSASSEVPKEDAFTLYDQSTGETLQVSGRELLPAAIACEMDLFSPGEALKAQAVACYTLFSRKRAAGETIACDSANWQVWTTEDVMREHWGEDYEDNMAILDQAAEQVYGQLLQWEGEPILAAYFAISSGSTENAGNVWEGELPYLRAVASPGDALSDGYLSTARFTPEGFREAAASYFAKDPPELSGPEESWLTDVECTASGYVKSAVLGGKTVSGPDLRSAFSLRSACFQIEYTEGEFVFTVRGWGHGVGMSQAGAVFLAKRGADYREILAHYYPGASLTQQG